MCSSSSNNSLLWPKEWQFQSLKSALENADQLLAIRSTEIENLVLFIKCYYEDTAEPCPDSEALFSSQEFSLARLEKVFRSCSKIS
jgi:hypothetical protein